MTAIGATAVGVRAVRNVLLILNVHKHRIYYHSLMILVINRPGVAGAVL